VSYVFAKRNKFLVFIFELWHRIQVILGALLLTTTLFLLLPLIQTIKKAPEPDLIVQSVDTAYVPPPPPPEEKVEKEVKSEEKPPELKEAAPPLDLAQLELALNPNPGFSDSYTGGDFAVKLNSAVTSNSDGGNVDGLFSLADLDQQPRVIYQPGPVFNAQLRKKTPGTVYVLFIVDQGGRVENPIVQKSSDTSFEASALAAVKQWKFEPGKRNGQAVKFRMRVPISFPKG
jgi:protein TonB